MRLSEELIEKYKDTPYINFVKYIATTNRADFEWTEKMIEQAKEQAVEEELEESLEVAKKNKTVSFAKGQENRARRIRFFAQIYKEQILKMEKKGHQLDEKDYEKMKEFQIVNAVPKLYPNKEESLVLEFSTKYLASLSDMEFMSLLRETGKVNDEQYKSLTRKYKEIDLQKEYMTHGQWDKISAEQSLATEKGNEISA